MEVAREDEALTNIEQINRNHHDKINDGKDGKDPEPDCCDEVGYDSVDDGTSDGEGDYGDGGAFCSSCEGEAFGWVYPAKRDSD